MIDAYTAAYASVSYATQTTSLSLSLQQNKISDDTADPAVPSIDSSKFSLNYTTTTTVATFSLLYVQEAGNSSEAEDDGNGDDQNGQTALNTVLAGPEDPYNPLEAAASSVNTALNVLEGNFESFHDDDDDDKDHANKGQGNAFGHAVRDNNHGHTKNDIQAAYSVAQLEVSTTSVAITVVA